MAYFQAFVAGVAARVAYDYYFAKPAASPMPRLPHGTTITIRVDSNDKREMLDVHAQPAEIYGAVEKSIGDALLQQGYERTSRGTFVRDKSHL